MYVEFIVGKTVWFPEIAFVPNQPLLAVQDVALVEDQERVEEEPEVMEVGEAERESVGGGVTIGAVTTTLTDLFILPPAPVQVSVYVEFVVGVTICVPEVVLVLDQAPLAVQDVALVEDQVRVEEEPEVMEVGEADRESVGGGVVVVQTGSVTSHHPGDHLDQVPEAPVPEASTSPLTYQNIVQPEASRPRLW